MLDLPWLAALGALAVIVSEGASAWLRGGPRQLVWPPFVRGWEVACALRLAAAPWIALFVVSLANLLALLIEEVEGGLPSLAEVWLWLAAASVAAMIGPFMHRRSRRVAALSLCLLAALWAALASHGAPAALLLPGLVFLLWALNGLRAALVDASIG
ncbi:hypothetical protein [Marinimicrococcus flavescens]|uniref:Uncharacterized protein n=1 Tax=Marinimicrococcus flavescens TaxID=3031815 RepID=A0AAP3XPB6_9PROT|nr:hypothetical protein [Marinimicrococcus flavescens]